MRLSYRMSVNCPSDGDDPTVAQVILERTRSQPSDHPSFTVTLHGPVRFFQHMQPKTIAINGSIERR